MTDLETMLRDSLQTHAGDTAMRRMPAGTPARARRRQAITGLGGLAVVALVVAGAVGLWSVIPRGGMGELAGNGEPLHPPEHPIEVVPQGWPRVDVVAPEDAPYVHDGETAGTSGPVTVVAAGTAGGALFSYMAWVTDDPTWGDGPCIGFAGPWGGGAPPTEPALQGFGGIVSGTCADAQEVPSLFDLYAAGQQEPETTPGIAANYGFLSERVSRLEVVLDDGTVFEPAILDGPEGWDGMRTFLFFPPLGRTGTVTAYDAEGRALARSEICEARTGGVSGGCGGPVEQLVPVP